MSQSIRFPPVASPYHTSGPTPKKRTPARAKSAGQARAGQGDAGTWSPNAAIPGLSFPATPQSQIDEMLGLPSTTKGSPGYKAGASLYTRKTTGRSKLSSRKGSGLKGDNTHTRGVSAELLPTAKGPLPGMPKTRAPVAISTLLAVSEPPMTGPAAWHAFITSVEKDDGTDDKVEDDVSNDDGSPTKNIVHDLGASSGSLTQTDDGNPDAVVRTALDLAITRNAHAPAPSTSLLARRTEFIIPETPKEVAELRDGALDVWGDANNTRMQDTVSFGVDDLSPILKPMSSLDESAMGGKRDRRRLKFKPGGRRSKTPTSKWQNYIPESAQMPVDSVTNVPLKTADNVLAYYSRHGSDAAIKQFYLNAAPATGGEIQNPYALEVVPYSLRAAEYFMITYRGVFRNQRSSKSSVFTPLHIWARHSAQFRLLSQIPFFKHLRLSKTFAAWKSYRQYVKLCRTRIYLLKSFLLCDRTAYNTLQSVREQCLEMLNVELQTLPPASRLMTPPELSSLQDKVRKNAFLHLEKQFEAVLVAVLAACRHLRKEVDLKQQINVYENEISAAQDLAYRRTGIYELESSMYINPEASDILKKLTPIAETKFNRVEWNQWTPVRLLKVATFLVNETLFQGVVQSLEVLRARICDNVEHGTRSTQIPEREPVAVINLVSDPDDGEIFLETTEMEFVVTMHDTFDQIVSLSAEFETLMCSAPLETYLKDDFADHDHIIGPGWLADHMKQSRFYIEAWDEIEAQVHADFVELEPIVAGYSFLTDIFRKCKTWLAQSTRNAVDEEGVAHVKSRLELLREWENSLQAIPFKRSCGSFIFSCKKVRTSLMNTVTEYFNILEAAIPEVVLAKCKLGSEVTEAVKEKVLDEPKTIPEYTKYCVFMDETERISYEEIKSILTTVNELISLMDAFHFVRDSALTETVAEFDQQVAAFHQLVNVKKVTIVQQQREHYAKEIDQEFRNLRIEVQTLNTMISGHAFSMQDGKPKEMLGRANVILRDLYKVRDQYKQLHSYQATLDLELTMVNEFKVCNQVVKDAEQVVEIWQSLFEWEEQIEAWTDVYFLSLRGQDIYDRFMLHRSRLTRLQLRHPTHEVVQLFAGRIREWYGHLPILLVLASSIMKDDHWGMLFRVLGLNYSEGITFTLSDLIDSGLFEASDAVAEISRTASQDSALDNFRKKILQGSGKPIANPRTEMTILLCENCPFFQRLTVRMLKKLGYQTINIAKTGHEAVAAMTHKQYNIVIAECDLPGLDAFGIMAKVRHAASSIYQPRLPVIGMSSNDEAQMRKRCMSAHMTGFCPKPTTVSQLSKVLEPIESTFAHDVKI